MREGAPEPSRRSVRPLRVKEQGAPPPLVSNHERGPRQDPLPHPVKRDLAEAKGEPRSEGAPCS